MYKKGALLTFYAETPVHMGAGQSVSYVDLPVQRERHTNFPVLWSSGIKGVLRDLAYRKCDKNTVEIIFGPEENSSDFASCISITDAKILLYPVRSVRGVFAWITCPFVLKRFKEDLKVLGKTSKDSHCTDLENLLLEIDCMLNDKKTIVPENSLLKIEGQNKVVLEEFVFEANENEGVGGLVKTLKEILPENNLIESLEKRLAIVSDNVFKDFVRYAVEIRTRIRIDQSTGTVKGSALFTEELIPSESVFYSLLFISDPFFGIDRELLELLKNKKGENKERDGVKKEIKDKIEELKNSNDENKRREGERLEREFNKIKDKVEDKIKSAYKNNILSSDGVLDKISKLVEKHPILQLGGDETLGRGIMRVRLYPENKGGENEQEDC